MTLDIHAHMYPQPYVEFLERKGGESARLARHMDSRARTLSRFTVTGTISEHVGFMSAAGIDRQVLSITSSSILVEDVARCADHAEAANDALADVCSQFPERLFQFAVLPLVDPDASLRELDRVRKQLGAVGVTIPTHVLGRPLDWEGMEPVYSSLEEQGLPIFLHPSGPPTPVTPKGYKEYGITSSLYFTVEDSNALMRMVYSGVFQRHPGLRVICAHMGGVIPLWLWRVEEWTDPGMPDKWDLPHSPSFYLKKVKYDTACQNAPAVRCACETYGTSQMVLGTDYPCEDMKRIVATVKSLGLNEAELSGILEDNLSSWIPVRDAGREVVGAGAKSIV